MLNRRTVIAFETKERCSYWLPDSNAVIEMCAECGSEVCWLTPDQFAALAGLSVREVFRRIEANAFHSVETVTYGLRICPGSLKG
jgi:hypothetical protein